MNLSTNLRQTNLALASAMLLCGSMGLAQAPMAARSAATAPGQNPSMDPQMNGMQCRTTLGHGQDVRVQGDAGQHG